MNLTIVNLTSSVRGADLATALRALQAQVTHDFQPEWGAGAVLRAVSMPELPKKGVPIDGISDAILYLGTSSEDPNRGVAKILGYHAATHHRIPFGFVYMNVVKAYGEVWTTTLSHEILELLADPSAATSIAGPAPKEPRLSVHWDLEVCDPVQGDVYEIHGVKVSNFVHRSYFGLSGGGASTNFMGLPLDPFGVRPGGYTQYEAEGRTHTVYGATAKTARARRDAARASLGDGRRNNRRARRFPPAE